VVGRMGRKNEGSFIQSIHPKSFQDNNAEYEERLDIYKCSGSEPMRQPNSAEKIFYNVYNI